ncbi:hypothetical protein ISTM_295 [Insectomime virus]|nr:hypothetical protein ISTM_295 [Insectomime virus]
MASLKLLCACKVSEKTGIEELDVLLDEVRDFASAGKDGTVQGIFFVHSDFVQRFLGWKLFRNEQAEFYLNKQGKICGLWKRDKNEEFGSQTTYFNGKKHGLEVIRRHSSGYWRIETQWKNGKKNGKSAEYGYKNIAHRIETYKDDVLKEIQVFCEHTGKLLLRKKCEKPL